MEKTIDINSDLQLQIKNAPVGWFVHLKVSTDMCDWKNTWKCYAPMDKWVSVSVMGHSEKSEEDAINDLRKEVAKQIKSLQKKTDPRLSMTRRLELLSSISI
jgi:hypothetical protein